MKLKSTKQHVFPVSWWGKDQDQPWPKTHVRILIPNAHPSKSGNRGTIEIVRKSSLTD